MKGWINKQIQRDARRDKGKEERRNEGQQQKGFQDWREMGRKRRGQLGKREGREKCLVQGWKKIAKGRVESSGVVKTAETETSSWPRPEVYPNRDKTKTLRVCDQVMAKSRSVSQQKQDWDFDGVETETNKGRDLEGFTTSQDKDQSVSKWRQNRDLD